LKSELDSKPLLQENKSLKEEIELLRREQQMLKDKNDLK